MATDGVPGLEMVCDHRLGMMRVRLSDGSARSIYETWVPLAQFLQKLELMPEEVRQLALDAQSPRLVTDRSVEELCRQAIPMHLTGKTVLDIGGYDGRFAKLCLARGATSAICLDNEQYEQYVWDHPARLPGVDYRFGDFMNAGWLEPADLVIFYNVIYHCQDPMGALRRLRQLTRETALVCSLTRFDDQPRWYLYSERECNPEDPTVYWGPSPSGLIRALEMAGFEEVGAVGKAVERLVLRCR